MVAPVTINASLNLNTGSIQASAKQVQQALGRITGQASEFQKSLDASTARVFAFGATTSILAGVGVAFKKMIASTIEVEKRLTEINSIFQASEETFNSFRNSIFQVAKDTGQSFSIVADGAAELARQGLSAEETASRLKDALILTRISGLGAEQSVKALTAAINGFTSAGLSSAQIVNKLVAVDTNFAVSAQDLADGFSRAGSTAEDAGVSFDELLGLITSVQQQTSRGGAVIGNAFKSIFTRLSRGSTIDDLKELGVEINSAQSGTQKLQALAEALERTSDPTTANQIKELAGGVYQINVVSAALKDLSSETSLYAQATKIAAGASDEATQKNAQLNQTLAANINALVVGLTSVGEKIGSLTFGPVLSGLVDVANKFSEFIDKAFDPEKGNKFIQGLFAVIGKFLAGPGLALFTVAFLKIFKLIATFAKDGLKSIFEIGSQTEKIKSIEGGIVQLLSKDQALRQALASTTATQAQKQQAIIAAIQRENALLTQQEQILRNIATIAAQRGVSGFSAQRGFSGKGGNRFATGFQAEEATAMMLGAPKSVKAKYGKGTIGGQKFIMNSHETEIPNFGRNGDSAVIPHYAKGFVPNFAIGAKQLAKIASESRVNAEAIVRNTYGKRSAEEVAAAKKRLKELDKKEAQKAVVTKDKMDDFFMLTPLLTSRVGRTMPRTIDKVGYEGGSPIHGVNQESRSKISDKAENALEQRIIRDVSRDAIVWTNKLKPLGRTITAADMKQGFSSGSEQKGAYGAIQSAVGAAFEIAMTKALDYKAETFGAGDFDVRGGKNINNIRQLFGIPASMSVGDFKSGYSKDTEASFYKKIGREVGVIGAGSLDVKSKKKKLAAGFIPNFVRSSRMMGSAGAQGGFYKLNKEVGVKKFNKGGSDQNLNNSVVREWLSAKYLADSTRGQMISGPEILSSLSDSMRKKSIRKQIISDQLARNAVGGEVARKFGTNSLRKYLLQKLGLDIPDLHGSNYTVNEAAKDYLMGDASKKDAAKFNVIDTGLAKAVGANAQSAYKALMAESMPAKGKASGFIPNYIDPLKAAIDREMKAGVPASSIYVDKDPLLSSYKNPMGLGVFNTRDEPNGPKDGINRSKSMGINPKNHGRARGYIPNFISKQDTYATVAASRGGYVSNTLPEVKQTAQLVEAVRKLDIAFRAGNISAKGYEGGLKAVGKTYGMSINQVGDLRKRLENFNQSAQTSLTGQKGGGKMGGKTSPLGGLGFGFGLSMVGSGISNMKESENNVASTLGATFEKSVNWASIGVTMAGPWGGILGGAAGLIATAISASLGEDKSDRERRNIEKESEKAGQRLTEARSAKRSAANQAFGVENGEEMFRATLKSAKAQGLDLSPLKQRQDALLKVMRESEFDSKEFAEAQFKLSQVYNTAAAINMEKYLADKALIPVLESQLRAEQANLKIAKEKSRGLADDAVNKLGIAQALAPDDPSLKAMVTGKQTIAGATQAESDYKQLLESIKADTKMTEDEKGEAIREAGKDFADKMRESAVTLQQTFNSENLRIKELGKQIEDLGGQRLRDAISKTIEVLKGPKLDLTKMQQEAIEFTKTTDPEKRLKLAESLQEQMTIAEGRYGKDASKNIFAAAGITPQQMEQVKNQNIMGGIKNTGQVIDVGAAERQAAIKAEYDRKKAELQKQYVTARDIEGDPREMKRLEAEAQALRSEYAPKFQQAGLMGKLAEGAKEGAESDVAELTEEKARAKAALDSLAQDIENFSKNFKSEKGQDYMTAVTKINDALIAASENVKNLNDVSLAMSNLNENTKKAIEVANEKVLAAIAKASSTEQELGLVKNKVKDLEERVSNAGR